MEKSYIPKAEEKEFCEGINLCTVRKNANGVSKIGIKNLNGKVSEEFLEEVINSDTYKGKEIQRIYASGHVFFDEKKEKVYLVETERDGKIQHQFTGGSPKEDENKNVILKEDGVYKFDLEKIRVNAQIRAKIRLGINVLENYNEKPIVDWVLIESKNDDLNKNTGEIYYKLVCLIHFIAKKFTGILLPTGEEYAVGGDWYDVKKLKNLENIAPNAEIVVNESLNFLKNIEK